MNNGCGCCGFFKRSGSTLLTFKLTCRDSEQTQFFTVAPQKKKWWSVHIFWVEDVQPAPTIVVYLEKERWGIEHKMVLKYHTLNPKLKTWALTFLTKLPLIIPLHSSFISSASHFKFFLSSRSAIMWHDIFLQYLRCAATSNKLKKGSFWCWLKLLDFPVK